MAVEADERRVRPSEAERIIAWRMEMFWELGFVLEQCEALTRSGADWHEADALLRQGCTTRWVFQYLT